MTEHGFELDTPIGRIRGVVAGGTLVRLALPNCTRAAIDELPSASAASRRVRDRIARYFRGDLDAIAGIPTAPPAGTAFQRRVWRALTRIPVGSTISYAELARRIDAPRAVRAVGSANGANPIGLVVPCHRVIAADGTLGGYGGGLEMKTWLLRHEGALGCNETRRAS